MILERAFMLNITLKAPLSRDLSARSQGQARKFAGAFALKLGLACAWGAPVGWNGPASQKV